MNGAYIYGRPLILKTTQSYKRREFWDSHLPKRHTPSPYSVSSQKTQRRLQRTNKKEGKDEMGNKAEIVSHWKAERIDDE